MEIKTQPSKQKENTGRETNSNWSPLSWNKKLTDVIKTDKKLYQRIRFAELYGDYKT